MGSISFRIGTGGILTIILTLAKLAGLFPYSWWIVVAPICIAYAITLMYIAGLVVGLMMVGYDTENSSDDE